MIKMENHLGNIEISEQFFTSLVSDALSDAFGVAGLAPASGKKGRSTRARRGKSVFVGVRDGKLVISVHIQVTYGINISAAVDNIVHKITYTIEDVTGLPVAAVNVYVEGMQVN